MINYDPIFSALFIGFCMLQYVGLLIYCLIIYRFSLIGYALIGISTFCAGIFVLHMIIELQFTVEDVQLFSLTIGLIELILLCFANMNLLFANVIGRKEKKYSYT